MLSSYRCRECDLSFTLDRDYTVHVLREHRSKEVEK